jgi:PKD repeat protein
MKKTVLLSAFALFTAGAAFAQKARTILAGEITSNTTWYADTIYTLDGYVYVKNNATLTIQPGTLIKANAANKSSLIITRNAMINAAGTPTAPIVFTSSKPKGQRATGDWGGVIILGKAPINQPDLPSGPSVAIANAEPGGQRAIEGDLDNANGDGLYGGTDANHNSGVLSYVRLEFGGVVITPGNEINGLTMGGVGKGTQIDHIQVTQANDDGIEWFGGNVDGKYLISHRNIDDDFDTDFGFSGKIQFGLIIRDSSWYDRGSGPTTNGFESDNDGSGSALTPITSAVFSNITVMGPLAEGQPLTGALAGNSFNNGARIRRNSSESIFNSVFMGWPNALFIDGTASGDNFNSGALGFKNNVLAGNLNAINNSSSGLNVRQTIVANGTDTSAGLTSVYNDPFNYNNPDFGFKAGSVAASGASFSDSKLTDPFFTSTTYRGAFGGANNWTDCWTNFNPADEDYNAGPYVQQGAVAAFNATENDKEVTFTNGSIGKKLTFAWDFGVASSTTDTSSMQNPKYTYADTGTYLVRLTVSSPCGDSTISKEVKVSGSVGIEEETDNVGKVTIYPNPASTSATVEFELTEGTNVSINMFDISGRIVKSVPSQFMMTGNNTINIETSDLNAGIYFTNIATDKSNKTYRLIIIK